MLCVCVSGQLARVPVLRVPGMSDRLAAPPARPQSLRERLEMAERRAEAADAMAESLREQVVDLRARLSARRGRTEGHVAALQQSALRRQVAAEAARETALGLLRGDAPDVEGAMKTLEAWGAEDGAGAWGGGSWNLAAEVDAAEGAAVGGDGGGEGEGAKPLALTDGTDAAAATGPVASVAPPAHEWTSVRRNLEETFPPNPAGARGMEGSGAVAVARTEGPSTASSGTARDFFASPVRPQAARGAESRAGQAGQGEAGGSGSGRESGAVAGGARGAKNERRDTAGRAGSAGAALRRSGGGAAEGAAVRRAGAGAKARPPKGGVARQSSGWGIPDKIR